MNEPMTTNESQDIENLARSYYETIKKMKKQSDDKKTENTLQEIAKEIAEWRFNYLIKAIDCELGLAERKKKEAIIDQDSYSLTLATAMEASFSWFREIVQELILERKSMMVLQARLASQSMPMYDIEELKNEIEKLKTRSLEVRVEIPKKFEETFEWLQKQMKAWERGKKASERMIT